MIQQTRLKSAIFPSDGPFLQARASGSHKKKRFIVTIVFPLLQTQQVLIGHNKFVVLIDQLTFSGNSTRQVNWLYKILVVSLIMLKQTKRCLSVSFKGTLYSKIHIWILLCQLLKHPQLGIFSNFYNYIRFGCFVITF